VHFLIQVPLFLISFSVGVPDISDLFVPLRFRFTDVFYISCFIFLESISSLLALFHPMKEARRGFFVQPPELLVSSKDFFLLFFFISSQNSSAPYKLFWFAYSSFRPPFLFSTYFESNRELIICFSNFFFERASLGQFLCNSSHFASFLGMLSSFSDLNA